MAWLPEEVMADIHIIRQDYARAKQKYEAESTEENQAAYQEQYDRRARAIRSLYADGDNGVRHLSMMFRCSRGFIRKALEEETE